MSSSACVLFSLLRIAQVSFAAVRRIPCIYQGHVSLMSRLFSMQIVAGVVGGFLDEFRQDSDGWAEARWIYTEVIAGVSILLGLTLLIPVATSFFVWPRTCGIYRG